MSSKCGPDDGRRLNHVRHLATKCKHWWLYLFLEYPTPNWGRRGKRFRFAEVDFGDLIVLMRCYTGDGKMLDNHIVDLLLPIPIGKFGRGGPCNKGDRL